MKQIVSVFAKSATYYRSKYKHLAWQTTKKSHIYLHLFIITQGQGKKKIAELLFS